MIPLMQKLKLLKIMQATVSQIFAFHSVGNGGVSPAAMRPRLEAEPSPLFRAEVESE
jgi:hypothetical protein